MEWNCCSLNIDVNWLGEMIKLNGLDYGEQSLSGIVECGVLFIILVDDSNTFL